MRLAQVVIDGLAWLARAQLPIVWAWRSAVNNNDQVALKLGSKTGQKEEWKTRSNLITSNVKTNQNIVSFIFCLYWTEIFHTLAFLCYWVIIIYWSLSTHDKTVEQWQNDIAKLIRRGAYKATKYNTSNHTIKGSSRHHEAQ